MRTSLTRRQTAGSIPASGTRAGQGDRPRKSAPTHGEVAPTVEHLLCKQTCVGSNPIFSTMPQWCQWFSTRAFQAHGLGSNPGCGSNSVPKTVPINQSVGAMVTPPALGAGDCRFESYQTDANHQVHWWCHRRELESGCGSSGASFTRLVDCELWVSMQTVKQTGCNPAT